MAGTFPVSAEDADKLRILKSLSNSEQQVVLKTLTRLQQTAKTANEHGIDKLLKHSFSKEERLQLEMESLARSFEYRRNLLSEAVTASQVAQLLGTSRQTPHDRVRARTILAVIDNGALRFPLWQFDPQGPDGVIAGLPEVLKALQVSDFAKLSWLLRSNPFLDGLTPVEALKQGLKDRVLQEAAIVGYGQN